MRETAIGFRILFLVLAAVFALIGFWTLTPLEQVVDAATSLSQDRIFKVVVLCLLAAIAVKP